MGIEAPEGVFPVEQPVPTPEQQLSTHLHTLIGEHLDAERAWEERTAIVLGPPTVPGLDYGATFDVCEDYTTHQLTGSGSDFHPRSIKYRDLDDPSRPEGMPDGIRVLEDSTESIDARNGVRYGDMDDVTTTRVVLGHFYGQVLNGRRLKEGEVVRDGRVYRSEDLVRGGRVGRVLLAMRGALLGY